MPVEDDAEEFPEFDMPDIPAYLHPFEDVDEDFAVLDSDAEEEVIPASEQQRENEQEAEAAAATEPLPSGRTARGI